MTETSEESRGRASFRWGLIWTVATFLLKTSLFQSSFRLSAKRKGRYRGFPSPSPPNTQPGPLSILLTRAVRLLQRTRLHQRHHHAMAAVSVRAGTPRWALWGPHKGAETWNHHRSEGQTSFTVLKSLCALPFPPVLSPNPRKLLFLFFFFFA